MIEASRVDVIVPVYNAYEDLMACVASVRAHTERGSYRLILIDDGSPDRRIQEYFGSLAAESDPHLVLLHNGRNRGFVATANRGMAESDGCDVVLLNSDTLVTRGWLSKLVRCVRSDPRIGTVTPFSNNAEICSFPAFCANTPLDDLPALDLVARAFELAALPTYPDIPTAVGFCMYIRRALIRRIGRFDETAFGLGYGEENDFCMRAVRAGFRNVLCDDCFVAHTGSRSFDSKKQALVEANTRTLVARYPEYPRIVRSFIEGDPLRPIREVALMRLRLLERRHLPGILHILHSRKGGTEDHVRDLIRGQSGRYRHYLMACVGDTWLLEDGTQDAVSVFEIERGKDEPWSDFLNLICRTWQIGLCHVHHIAGSREGLMHALASLQIPWGLTLHDSYLACPTITFLDDADRYCGEITEPDACQRCVDRHPLYKGIAIRDWRAQSAQLVAGARFVIAPSEWIADTFRKYFPGIAVGIVPHGLEPEDLARPVEGCSALLLPDDGRRTIGVIGAIGPVKGARRLERLVARTRERGLPLCWVVVGYLDTQYEPKQDKTRTLTVHGAYRKEHLKALLDHYRIDVVAFPSEGPESFSYTLSECWALGRPALVPPIGALGERVRASGAGWVMNSWQDEDRILDELMTILSPEGAADLAEKQRAALAVASSTLRKMALDTETHYARVLGGTLPEALDGTAVRELDRWRLQASVRSCQPLSPTRIGSIGNRILKSVAQLGLKARYTRAGHWLYRTTPLSWQREVKRWLVG